MGLSVIRFIFNLTKGNNMPLIVNYTKHQNWSAKSQKFDDPKMRTEADQIGHLLMTIGVSEISDKTINEVIIRKLILDRFYGSQDHTIKEYKEIFNKHIGLFIEGRWANTETRWKFVARHAKGMMHDIAYKINN